MDYIFQPGERVKLHPSTDMWMRGARVGDVVRDDPSNGRVRVKLDAWPRALWFKRDLVEPVEERKT